jgi:hypothetical protein
LITTPAPFSTKVDMATDSVTTQGKPAAIASATDIAKFSFSLGSRKMSELMSNWDL